MFGAVFLLENNANANLKSNSFSIIFFCFLASFFVCDKKIKHSLSLWVYDPNATGMDRIRTLTSHNALFSDVCDMVDATVCFKVYSR